MTPTDPTAAPDPSAAPADPSTPDMSQGYTICLNVPASGPMTLSVEPLAGDSDDAAPSADASGAPAAGDDDQAQPVDNIQAALKLIREIVAHAGQIGDAQAGATDMQSGYGGGQ